jgi:3-isopropylmalate dehydrogenase
MNRSSYDIVVIPGDGIGHEVLDAAVAVMLQAANHAGLALRPDRHQAGAFHYRDTGEAISAATLAAIGQADATLFGAAGWPDIRAADGTEIAPQIDIREHFQLFAGLRPIRLWDGVPRVLARGTVDMLIVREQTEGLFAGRHDLPGNDRDSVSDRMTITRQGCERLFELSFALARSRKAAGKPGHVTLMDKANVLRGMAFMRQMFDEVAARHPDIATDRVYIDAGCMQLVTDPGRFDVVVSENQFGDITSEIAAGVAGGLGLAPSADLGAKVGMFQPSHGTAPDIAGKGMANPVAAILSVAMMLDWLADRHADENCRAAARAIEAAIGSVLANGPRTRDVGGNAGTAAVTEAVLGALRQ